MVAKSPCIPAAYPATVFLVVKLRLQAIVMGLVLVALEVSHYKDGVICTRYVKQESPYYLCAHAWWQLCALAIIEFSAGVVLASLLVALGCALQL